MADADVNVKITAQDKASAQINAVGKSLAGLSNQVSSVQSAVTSLASGGIPGLTKSFSTLTGVMSGTIPALSGLVGVVGAVGGSLVHMALEAADAVEQLDNMSAATGIAARDLEALQNIAKDAGLETADLTGSISQLNRQLADGSGGDFARVYAALGGSIKDGNGVVKDAVTLVDDLTTRLRGLGSEHDRAALASLAYGRRMAGLNQITASSTSTLKEQIDAQKASNRVMDEETRQAMRELDAAVDALAASWQGLGHDILGATVELLRFTRMSQLMPKPFLSPEALAKLQEDIGRSQIAREGAPTFPAGPFTKVTGAPKSPLEIQAEQEARAKGIASGKKGEELELTLKIEDAERRMKDVFGDKQILIAQEIAGYKRQLAAIEENKKLSEEMYDLNRKAVELAFEEWEKRDAAQKRLTEERYDLERKAVNETFDQWEKRDAERKKLDAEGYDLNRKAVQDAFDEWERGEEKRRADLDKYHDIFVKLNDQRDKQTEENRKQWERMLDTIRDGAGRVFDAMLTKGQSVFASLANFAQGLLQTMLRNIFQNAVASVMQIGAGGLSRIFSPGGAGGGVGGPGGGGAGGAAAGFAGMGIPFLSKLGGGARGAQLQQRLNPGGQLGGFAGFAGSKAGQAMTGGFAIGGQMLMMDAFKRGSAFEGMAGGAMAGMAVGTMIAPGIGTAIGAGVGAIAGLITGLFGGGAKRRAEEAAKRAAAQEAQKFAGPETITRFGIAGGAGYSVETDLTGSIRGVGVTPTVIVNVQNNMIDARHAREAGEVIGQEVSRQILQGGSYLGDNIAWAAS